MTRCEAWKLIFYRGIGLMWNRYMLLSRLMVKASDGIIYGGSRRCRTWELDLWIQIAGHGGLASLPKEIWRKAL